MTTIRVTVPKSRDGLGLIAIIDDLGCEAMSPRQCLAIAGKSKKNPNRNPVFRYGDVPLGTYRFTIQPEGEDVDEFGPYRVILLHPVAGQCVQALENGRDRLMIHGGQLQFTAGGKFDGLRPTFNGVRCFNKTMSKLNACLDYLGVDQGEVVITEE